MARAGVGERHPKASMESREGSPKAGGTPAGQIAGRGGREGPLSPWPFRQGWPCSGSLWLSLSGEAGLELPQALALHRPVQCPAHSIPALPSHLALSPGSWASALSSNGSSHGLKCRSLTQGSEQRLEPLGWAGVPASPDCSPPWDSGARSRP